MYCNALDNPRGLKAIQCLLKVRGDRHSQRTESDHLPPSASAENSVVKQAQFKFPLWVVGHSSLAYLLPGRTRNLSPQRLERRIEVEVVAVIQKIPAQIGDLHACWNGNGHDDGQRRRFGVLGGIGAGLQFFDVDAVAREECRQVVHDTGTVRRHQFDGVGNGGIGRFAFAGARDAGSVPVAGRARAIALPAWRVRARDP